MIMKQVVTGPIVQVYEHEGAGRLVVALPNSAILVSQEWLTTIARWSFFSGPKPGFKGSTCENKVCPSWRRVFVCVEHEEWPSISL